MKATLATLEAGVADGTIDVPATPDELETFIIN